MFTDVVGYTALAQADESQALALLGALEDIIRPVISKHGGREVKTMGDGSLIEFGSALDATESAVDMQNVLRERNEKSSQKLLVRVGIHVGDVIYKGGDLYGDAVNIASRIEPLAPEGGICISEQVYDQVYNKTSLSISSIGVHELKNVGKGVEVYRVDLPSALSDAPGQQPNFNRIAVLPFSNISPDPKDEYFADGMTEELISTLSNIREFRVISRTSVMGYRDSKKKLMDIGRELKVGNVVEGSVRKAGNRVRISVQLVDVSSDEDVWSESYDRDFDDVFAIESDIAKKVAEALRVRILPNETKQIERKSTGSTEAYSLYLKGRYHWNERSPDGLNMAIKYLELAIKEDPNYALAYAGLADGYLILADYGYLPPKEAYPKAEELAKRAMGLDESIAEVHVSIAYAKACNEWNWAEAEKEFKRAISLNPSHATAHHWYAALLASMERYEEATSEMSRAKELDPFSPIINVNVGTVYYLLGRNEQAIEAYRRAIEIDPNFALGHASLGLSYLRKSMVNEAIAESQNASILSSGSIVTQAELAYVYAVGGKREQAARMLVELEERAKKEFVPPLALAIIYSGMGDKDKSLSLLEKAYEERNITPTALSVMPWLVEARSEPRYRVLLKKMGL
jgi:adenylate cyclase